MSIALPLWLRSGLVLLLCSLAASGSALEFAEARHLLLRAGFGPERGLVQALVPLSRDEAVDLLLGSPGKLTAFPACVEQPPVPRATRKHWSPAERMAYGKQQRQCWLQLRQWYVLQLLSSDAVLREQMTLFWHNHFTSSLRKVREPQLIARQHRLLFEQALGSFNELLLGVVQDPAMLVYLDNVNNRKRKPNENLARELLELFTMGEGHYSEQDIREAARALTGLSIDPGTFGLRFYEKRHDGKNKTIFGQSGRFDALQLVELILRQPATSKYITRRLWLHFVSEPDEAEIDRLAGRFAQSWDIAGLVRAILLSEPFWRDQGRMIKAPIDLVVGNGRLFGPGGLPVERASALMRHMGQDLFDPPNVKGWAVDEWIEPGRMLIRIRIGERLIRGFSNEAMMSQRAYLCSERSPEEFSAIRPVLGASPPDDCQQQLEALVSDPVWQLK